MSLDNRSTVLTLNSFPDLPGTLTVQPLDSPQDDFRRDQLFTVCDENFAGVT